MRFLVIIFIVYSFRTSGQDFESLSEHTTMEELFGKRDSSFQIEEYRLYKQNGSPELIGGCIFSFLDSEVIMAREFGKRRFQKTTYWKWRKNERGDKFGYIEECNKKGIIKRINLDFETIKSEIVGPDLIVNEVTWSVDRHGDTACWFIDKWIYRRDTLVEYWHTATWRNHESSWDKQERYSIDKYSYPEHNVINTELIHVEKNQKKSVGIKKEVKSYNELGRLKNIKLTYSYLSYEIEYRYFYKNGMWFKTEYWEDNKLKEIVKKQMLVRL